MVDIYETAQNETAVRRRTRSHHDKIGGRLATRPSFNPAVRHLGVNVSTMVGRDVLPPTDEPRTPPQVLRMDALHDRWAASHAASLPLIRATAEPEMPSPSAAAARLPPGTLDKATLSLALAREAAARGSSTDALARCLDDLEDTLDDMYAHVHESRSAVAALPLEAADDRGPHGVLLSPADEAAIAASSLPCYEQELALKRQIAQALEDRSLPLPEKQVAALLVAWQCQPMLEPVDAMRAGEQQQRRYELALKTEPARDGGQGEAVCSGRTVSEATDATTLFR